MKATMTREKFVEKAVKEYERNLRIPVGWWGTWRDVYGPKGERVRFSGAFTWTVSLNGERISVHGSREGAINAARKLHQRRGPFGDVLPAVEA